MGTLGSIGKENPRNVGPDLGSLPSIPVLALALKSPGVVGGGRDEGILTPPHTYTGAYSASSGSGRLQEGSISYSLPSPSNHIQLRLPAARGYLPLLHILSGRGPGTPPRPLPTPAVRALPTLPPAELQAGIP